MHFNIRLNGLSVAVQTNKNTVMCCILDRINDETLRKSAKRIKRSGTRR